MQSTPTPTTSTPNPNPNQNLTSAFLFLRTASTAVTNLTAQTASTKAYIQHLSPPQSGHQYRLRMVYAVQLKSESRDLALWETRLEQAGVGFVDWVAKARTGRWLPGEILGMIGELLRVRVRVGRGGEEWVGLVLPDVWKVR